MPKFSMIHKLTEADSDSEEYHAGMLLENM